MWVVRHTAIGPPSENQIHAAITFSACLREGNQIHRETTSRGRTPGGERTTSTAQPERRTRSPITTAKPRIQTAADNKSWLDAKGELDLVREPICAWLKEHPAALAVGFVARAWLENGGEFEAIADCVFAWLPAHQLDFEATYVLKFVARQRELPVTAINGILAWSRAFPEHPDALDRMVRLGSNLVRSDLATGITFTAEELLNVRLGDAGCLSDRTVIGQITSMLTLIAKNPGVEQATLSRRVDALFRKWLRCPESYGSQTERWVFTGPKHVERVAHLLDIQDMDVDDPKNRIALGRFVQWIRSWPEDQKKHVRGIFAALREDHPAPGLWEID